MVWSACISVPAVFIKLSVTAGTDRPGHTATNYLNTRPATSPSPTTPAGWEHSLAALIVSFILYDIVITLGCVLLSPVIVME